MLDDYLYVQYKHAILRVNISFGSHIVNAAASLIALCENLPFSHHLTSSGNQPGHHTGWYIMAIFWWWFDFTMLSTGLWEKFLEF